MKQRARRISPFLAALSMLTAALVLFAFSHGSSCPVKGDTGQPVQYCGFIDFSVTNSTGGDLTDYPVRFEAPISGLISTQRADNMGWQWYCAESSFSNGRNLFLQGLTESTSDIWIVFPDLPDGDTRTVRCYIGRAGTQRDQGLWFTGGERLVRSADADFNINDNLRIDVLMENLSETARSEAIIDHQGGGTSYRVLLLNSGGALHFQTTLDGLSCSVAWDSSWTDEKTLFTVRYVAATGDDTFIDVNGVNVEACDLDAGALGSPGVDLVIGQLISGALQLNDVIVRDIIISESGDIVAHWGFDGPSASETGSTNPYTGIIVDYSPNTEDATYTFDRDQAGLTTSVGAYTLSTAATGPEFVAPEVDVVGEILPGSAFGAVGNENASTWPLMLFNPPATSVIPRTAYWTLLLSAFAVLFGLLAYMLSTKVIIALVSAGAVYTLGVADGVLPVWWLIYWAFAVAFAVASSRWSREA